MNPNLTGNTLLQSYTITCLAESILQMPVNSTNSELEKEAASTLSWMREGCIISAGRRRICYCMMPETYDDMVECEECEAW